MFCLRGRWNPVGTSVWRSSPIDGVLLAVCTVDWGRLSDEVDIAQYSKRGLRMGVYIEFFWGLRSAFVMKFSWLLSPYMNPQNRQIMLLY